MDFLDDDSGHPIDSEDVLNSLNLRFAADGKPALNNTTASANDDFRHRYTQPHRTPTKNDEDVYMAYEDDPFRGGSARKTKKMKGHAPSDSKNTREKFLKIGKKGWQKLKPSMVIRGTSKASTAREGGHHVREHLSSNASSVHRQRQLQNLVQASSKLPATSPRSGRSSSSTKSSSFTYQNAGSSRRSNGAGHKPTILDQVRNRLNPQEREDDQTSVHDSQSEDTETEDDDDDDETSDATGADFSGENESLSSTKKDNQFGISDTTSRSARGGSNDFFGDHAESYHQRHPPTQPMHVRKYRERLVPNNRRRGEAVLERPQPSNDGRGDGHASSRRVSRRTSSNITESDHELLDSLARMPLNKALKSRQLIPVSSSSNLNELAQDDEKTGHHDGPPQANEASGTSNAHRKKAMDDHVNRMLEKWKKDTPKLDQKIAKTRKTAPLMDRKLQQETEAKIKAFHERVKSNERRAKDLQKRLESMKKVTQKSIDMVASRIDAMEDSLYLYEEELLRKEQETKEDARAMKHNLESELTEKIKLHLSAREESYHQLIRQLENRIQSISKANTQSNDLLDSILHRGIALGIQGAGTIISVVAGVVTTITAIFLLPLPFVKSLLRRNPAPAASSPGEDDPAPFSPESSGSGYGGESPQASFGNGVRRAKHPTRSRIRALHIDT